MYLVLLGSDNMSPRERVRVALNHQAPDRVPIDNGGFVSSMHKVTYEKLLNYLGIKEDEIEIYDFMQQLPRVNEQVLQRLHVDTRYLYAGSVSNWKLKLDEEGCWYDEWGVRKRPCELYYEDAEGPLAEATVSDLKNWSPPNPTDPARFEGLEKKAQSLYQNTDFALVAGACPTIYTISCELRGYARYQEDLLLHPDFIQALADIILDWNIAFMEEYLDPIGEYIEYCWVADDFGTQSGPVMNPRLFRSIFKPRWKKIISHIKSKTRAKVCYHSCGSVYWAMQDFIDMGVDILQPVQSGAKDMQDSQRIKSLFGDQLCFHGGIDNQHVLPRGSPREVEEEVEKRIKAFAPGGGYIFSCGHNIQPDVSPESVLTAFDTAHEFGRYPIQS